jgi:hypothetical protein
MFSTLIGMLLVVGYWRLSFLEPMLPPQATTERKE